MDRPRADAGSADRQGAGSAADGSTATPLIAGAGIALAALSLAYGPVFLVAAAPPLLVAAVRWVGAASREWVAVERDEPS